MNQNRFYSLIIVVFFIVGGFFIFQQMGIGSESKQNNEKKGFESSKNISEGTGYGVSSSNPIAVQVGMEVLENGGNAVDAAIAVSYTLGVVEPYGSGIGGGGGMLILPGDPDKEPAFFDYRETSPASDNDRGKVGIPGFVKGMEVIHKQYGQKEIADLIAPSIELADEGFEVGRPLSERLAGAAYRMPVNDLPNFYPEGSAIQEGEELKQPELAETLQLIQEEGSDAFYQGQIAKKIVSEVPGIKESDLKSYSVKEREPVYGEFSGYEVISAPPPFSGITLIQSLQMAEMLNIEKTADNVTDFTHLIGEISKRANHDRLKNIGDPAFYKVNVDELTEKDYSKSLSQDISLEELSNQYRLEGEDAEEEHISTTHFVVTDKEGTMVSVTNTLSNFFGTGKNVDGFFLNNNLENFNKKSSSPNYYEPGKISRTFTAPTILRSEDEIIGIGTPGGSRIPMMLTEVLVRHLKFNEPLQDAIETPRFSVENDHIYTEIQYPVSVQNELNDIGYDVEMNSSPLYYGGIQAIVIDKSENIISGGADPRREGTWMVK
ncbi:MAG TPA: gamma-glutamyltransferase [Ureibacillus sp.]|uniref:gamma-glutamyltransferase family protein n=1 Tax=Peribacillus asahii TaxID=228899 RepID=UPI00207A2FE8|nr:gamma-glutamyltransferase [Peribacillus asahii]USK58394.1 gamma-glutamyltransferase [Peribacillus asahii]HWL24641.1 gamma-glutamyltransferase [Ureibacillus sp.]